MGLIKHRRHDGIEYRVVRLNTRDSGLQEFLGTYLACAYERCQPEAIILFVIIHAPPLTYGHCSATSRSGLTKVHSKCRKKKGINVPQFINHFAGWLDKAMTGILLHTQ